MAEGEIRRVEVGFSGGQAISPGLRSMPPNGTPRLGAIVQITLDAQTYLASPHLNKFGLPYSATRSDRIFLDTKTPCFWISEASHWPALILK